MSRRRLHFAVFLLFVAGTVGIFVLLFRAAGGEIRVSGRDYHITATVPTAVALVPNADVRAAGVKVGKIRSVAQDGHGGAKIEFTLSKAIAPLDRDARVEVRTKTLLGENYLAVEPGTPAAGTIPDGGSLAPAQADDPVQLDKILSVFDPATRKAVAADLKQMGAGFGGRGQDLNDTLGALAPTARDATTVASLLADQRDDVIGVVAHTGNLLQTLGARQRDIDLLVRSGRRTADLLAARDQKLRQSVLALPGFLRQTKSTAVRLSAFAGAATPTVNDLTGAATALTPMVTALQPAARDARKLVDRVPALARAANPLLTALRRVARETPATVNRLGALLTQANPALRYLSPYSREVGSFFANVGAMNSEYDATGAFARVFPIYGPTATGLISPQVRPLYERLLAVTGISKISNVRANQYPKPGAIGKNVPSDGQVPSLPTGR